MVHQIFPILRKSVIPIILALYCQGVTGQERYHASAFDSVEVNTYTYMVKDGINLQLDVYQPAFDPEGNRAVVLYVHGGGFSSGRRDNPAAAAFCHNLAEYGYTAVSVSYRLTRQNQPSGFGCDCPAIEKRNTFQAAVEDVQDATFFLINNREMLGIDPQKIILAGSSAGAETVLNTAYQPPYCYGLDSGPVSYAGVIAMAGAIPDTVRLFKESAIPSLFFHGTCDNLIPYASAPHHYCKPTQPGYLLLHGPFTIAQKLKQLGIPHWLHTTCGGTHELAAKPMSQYFDVIIRFCYDFVLNGSGEAIHTIIPGDAKTCDYEYFNFCNP